MTQPARPEQIAVAQLNSWDPQELADSTARVARIHQLMRRHSHHVLVRMAINGGLDPACQPAGWSKQEVATEVARQEFRQQASS